MAEFFEETQKNNSDGMSWYYLGIVQCRNCLNTRFAGCHCLDNEYCMPAVVQPEKQSRAESPGGARSIISPSPLPAQLRRACSTESTMSLCTVPTLTNENVNSRLHLQCKSGRCSTMHMIAKPCERCGCDPKSWVVKKAIVEYNEFQTLLQNYDGKVHGKEIRHTVLRCRSCGVVAFPSSTQLLTVLKTSADGGGSVGAFFDPLTKRNFDPHSWDAVVVHYGRCKAAGKPLTNLLVKLNKHEITMATQALKNSRSIPEARVEIRSRQEHRKTMKLKWAALMEHLQLLSVDAKTSAEEMGGTILELFDMMLGFCLGVKYEMRAMYIFGLQSGDSMGDVKRRICAAVKTICTQLGEQWSVVHRQLFSRLLRVMNTLAFEDQRTTVRLCDEGAA